MGNSSRDGGAKCSTQTAQNITTHWHVWLEQIQFFGLFNLIWELQGAISRDKHPNNTKYTMVAFAVLYSYEMLCLSSFHS